MKQMKTIAIAYITLTLVFVSCNKSNDTLQTQKNINIEEQLATLYTHLPEKAISKSVDGRVYAQYAMPTTKYSHSILGDNIEAEQLVVNVDGLFYDLKPESNYVFEDIRPRLYDVDGDNESEFITIRTNIPEGAGIVIYKILNGELNEYAYVEEIGTPYRWLNIVAINDLDNDGIVELAWIETPHIGGILKVAKISSGLIKPVAEISGYSNHAIGERNLCLSAITVNSGQKVFYIPNQSRDNITGFTFENNTLTIFEEIDMAVDFSNTLSSQYNFKNIIPDEVNCINY